MHIGYHESTSNGLEGLGKEALKAGADTFAFFTRNPRGGSAKPVEKDDAEKLNSLRKEHNFAPPVAHAPYTMNPCSADPHLREYALEMMTDDFKRLEFTPGCFYNFHPGSHTGQGADFDKIIGLKRLHAIHLNDSMNDLGAHKDRHQKIGQGFIGLEALVRVINHPSLKELPFILETPNEFEGYKQEIELLKSKVH